MDREGTNEGHTVIEGKKDSCLSLTQLGQACNLGQTLTQIKK